MARRKEREAGKGREARVIDQMEWVNGKGRKVAGGDQKLAGNRPSV